MVSSLAPDSHSSRSCLRVIFRNWSLWSVRSRKPGRRIVRRPLNNPDTYYSMSEYTWKHFSTDRVIPCTYRLVELHPQDDQEFIFQDTQLALTKKATLQKLLLLSLPPNSTQAALLSEQWQWKWVVQLMKFLACLMSVKDVKNESPWNSW